MRGRLCHEWSLKQSSEFSLLHLLPHGDVLLLVVVSLVLGRKQVVRSLVVAVLVETLSLELELQSLLLDRSYPLERLRPPVWVLRRVGGRVEEVGVDVLVLLRLR